MSTMAQLAWLSHDGAGAVAHNRVLRRAMPNTISLRGYLQPCWREMTAWATMASWRESRCPTVQYVLTVGVVLDRGEPQQAVDA